MKYRLDIRRRAEKDLRSLVPEIRERILEKILELRDNPLPVSCKKLKAGMTGYRLRVGEWRVLYTIDDQAGAVTIAAVKHRREAYRD